MHRDSDEPRQIEGLDLFHAIYAIILAFGIQEAASAFYSGLPVWSSVADSADIVFTHLIIGFAILLLIIRFFWSTANIRGACERMQRAPAPFSRFAVLIHLPMLLVQGVLLLFVCLAFSEYVTHAASAASVITWFIIVTAWNASWLALLSRSAPRQNPERFWFWNNVSFVVVGLALLAVLSRQGAGSEFTAILFAVASIASSMFDLLSSADWYLSNIGR